MRTSLTITAMVVLLLGCVFVTPVAAQPGDNVDECQNAERGPGEDGPPGFVGNLMPDFLSDLFASLPVPNFVKTFFGASTC